MQTGKGLDRATYDETKTYLKAALEQMIAAGHSAEDLGEFAADKFGGSFYPYLREFQQDLRAGRIEVQGLTESSRTSIFGARVSHEERERMVREAAYLRAEQRGFVGGSPEEDWLVAEAQVDEILARKAGLFKPGKKALDTARETARKEVGSIQTVVYQWIEGKKPAAVGKAAAAISPEKPVKPEGKSRAATGTKAAAERKTKQDPTKSTAAEKARPAPRQAGTSGTDASTKPRNEAARPQTAASARKTKTDTGRRTGAGASKRQPVSKKPH